MTAPPKSVVLPSRRWSTAALMALLAAITALAPFSLQVFLPALPAIQASFAATPGIVQLALSLSILANAVANLAYGPLSDRLGRRPVLLLGLAAFVVGSFGCALAPSIELLIVGRIVQSIGGAAGMVLARAIVRDLFDRERSASIIAYLTMAMVVAPMLAPTIGAVLLDVVSWRAIFFVAAAIGVALSWPILAMLAETRPPEARSSGRSFAGASTLLRSGPFWSYVLQSTFGISVFFAFIAGAPYFMMDVLGRSATEYGLWFILVSAAFMAGNLVAGRFSARIGLDRMVLAGAVFAVTGARRSPP
jgi:MFS transporter, DHA1 family, multidrug resistance protein